MRRVVGDTPAVMYGVPPVCTEDAVKTMLKQTVEVTKASRLYWIPGDAAMAHNGGFHSGFCLPLV